VIVKQGQDKELAITCTINLGRDPFGVVRIFRQVKIDGKVTETVIAENEEVKEPYASTGRYSVDYSQDPSTDNNIAVLTIHGINYHGSILMVLYVYGYLIRRIIGL